MHFGPRSGAPHFPASHRIALLLALFTAGCGETAPRELFDSQVVPVLERHCAATICHGVRADSPEVDVVDWDALYFRVEADGSLSDLDAAYATAKRTITTTDAPVFSTLLRKPLPVSHGGLPHLGRDNFTSPTDESYQILSRWIEKERTGGEDEAPLTPVEQRFADQVQPALVSAGCLSANCHGRSSAVPYRLDPGVGGAFSRAASRHNYEVSKTMIALDGDPDMSRLLRKSLPLHDGGILHRGGNAGFFTGKSDSRTQAIRDWVCAEREATLGSPCAPAGDSGIRALVFVRGPVLDEAPLELDIYRPGSDLFVARFANQDLGSPDIENLTAAHHAEPADVRDPAVSPDATQVAFAMRTSSEGGHDLYQLSLESGELIRITNDAGRTESGTLRTYRDPTYGPDGELWFVSSNAATLADGGRTIDSDLYSIQLETRTITRRTYTPHLERHPVFLVHGEENGGEVCFTALRDAVGTDRRAHPFRFPPGLSTEYHQHFGITPDETLFSELRELPDGRYVAVIGDLDNTLDGGRLGIVDRNFGPEIPASMGAPSPSIASYAAPLTRLDPATSATGLTTGVYRDPVALPDGTLLAAYSSATTDLSDASAAALDTGIVRIRLTEGVRGEGPGLSERVTLIDEPGLADWDPQPVYPRQLATHPGRHAWDESAATGTYVHNGFPLIDALLSALPPTGTKAMRTDFRFIRLIEPVNLLGHKRPLTLTKVTPGRILAELPLAADGTFQAEVPAGIPFRVQGLNAARGAIGTSHNRWFYVAPGQRLVQGSQPAAYNQLCATCHGSLDGDPDHALAPPDVITTASINLSRFVARDPRKPIAPPLLGDATRSEVDFRRDVQPVLERACATAGCHAGATAAAGLSLDGTPTEWFTNSYEALLGNARSGEAFIDKFDPRAERSLLMAAIGRHLGGAVSLSRRERQLLTTWIDLGAAFVGTESASTERTGAKP